MRKVDETEYHRFSNKTSIDTPGVVYPLSVVEGIQNGDIFEDRGDFLIWHTGGFAFVSDKCSTTTLDFIHELMTDANNRRLILFSNDSGIKEYFSGKPDIVIGKRSFFSYDSSRKITLPLPDGFAIEEINPENIGKIHGKVVPSFYWGSDVFFKNGKGFCITHENKVVSWAFSAAVSSKELDIGVETDEHFRGLGLAAAVASKLAEYSLLLGKQPVWACNSENAASRKTAEKIGFVRTDECLIFRKK